MVNSCIIVGCTNRGENMMFSIPKIRRHEGEKTKEKTERRLLLWIKAINRKGITASNTKTHHKVCGEHFIKGHPAYYESETDPDWVPSLKLGYKGSESIEKVTSSTHRFERVKERRKRQLDFDVTRSSDIVTHPESEQDKNHEEREPEPEENPHGSGRNSTTQTEMCGSDLDQKESVINDLVSEIVELKKRVKTRSFDEDMFRDNNENVKYYTGLTTWHTLNCFVLFLSPFVVQTGRNTLSKFQEILLVLMKLRLGLSNKLMGDLFNIDRSTVSRIFLRVLNVMYWRSKFMILWPDREDLKNTMPQEFVKYFNRKVTVIIDCFEVFIETPTNIMAKVRTYSVYKNNNTIKYLIGITPQGSICFISDGYGGRTSDRFIVENSSFLSHLQLGDVVMADRGFDCHESVSFMCAELKIPAFTRGKKQLSPYEVESTRKIAHLRIHVERVIGQIRNKFTILKSEIPVDFIKTSDDDDITTLDQIITVCAVLSNMCPSIVPFN